VTNHRHALTDKQWTLVHLALPTGRRGPKSRLGDRNFIDAVLYRAKTGIAWRDLPERFGAWKTIYNKFSRWSHLGHWERIFKALQLDVDEDSVIIDSSIVRAHQDAAGGKGGSKAMHWVVLEVGSPRRSTPSSTRGAGRSTSNSRQASSTSRPSQRTSSGPTRAARKSSQTRGTTRTPSERA
jgi:putative transposase